MELHDYLPIKVNLEEAYFLKYEIQSSRLSSFRQTRQALQVGRQTAILVSSAMAILFFSSVKSKLFTT